MKKLFALALACLMLFSAALADDTLTINGWTMVLPEGCAMQNIGNTTPDENGNILMIKALRSEPSVFQFGLFDCPGAADLEYLQQALAAQGDKSDIVTINGLEMLLTGHPLEDSNLMMYEAVHPIGNRYLLLMIVVEKDNAELAATFLTSFRAAE